MPRSNRGVPPAGQSPAPAALVGGALRAGWRSASRCHQPAYPAIQARSRGLSPGHGRCGLAGATLSWAERSAGPAIRFVDKLAELDASRQVPGTAPRTAGTDPIPAEERRLDGPPCDGRCGSPAQHFVFAIRRRLAYRRLNPESRLLLEPVERVRLNLEARAESVFVAVRRRRSSRKGFRTRRVRRSKHRAGQRRRHRPLRVSN